MNFTWPKAKEDERRILNAITILFNSDKKLLEYLFEPDAPRLCKRVGILKEDAWRFGDNEQILIRAALDIWSGGGHLQLWEMIETWDRKNWRNFFEAMKVFLSRDREVK